MGLDVSRGSVARVGRLFGIGSGQAGYKEGRNMRRTALLPAMALLLAAGVPAWADHSHSTGINCSDFATQEDAQAYFNLHAGDPEGLDGPIGPSFAGIQNVACEDLPHRVATTLLVGATDVTSNIAPQTRILVGAEAQTRIVSITPLTATVDGTSNSAVPGNATTGRTLALTG